VYSLGLGPLVYISLHCLRLLYVHIVKFITFHQFTLIRNLLRLIKLFFCKKDANICDFLRVQISEKWANLQVQLNVQS